jgi:hypothetical protein
MPTKIFRTCDKNDNRVNSRENKTTNLKHDV